MSVVYQDLRDRALSLKSTYDLSVKNLKSSEEILKIKVEELKNLKEDKLIQESSIKILNQVIDTLSKEHIQAIIDMLTLALKTIFYDRDYSILLDIKELRNKNTCQLYLVEDGKEEDKVLIEDVGGGIKAVIGFTLQVFYIMYFKLKRVLFLDESLSAVSIEYIPYLMEFIKSLVDKRGFIFLAICHDNRFIEYADYYYIMDKGNLRLATDSDFDR